jgi:hypothetical protein
MSEKGQRWSKNSVMAFPAVSGYSAIIGSTISLYRQLMEVVIGEMNVCYIGCGSAIFKVKAFEKRTGLRNIRKYIITYKYIV